MKKTFILLLALISTSTNLFPATQDFKLNKEFPKPVVTLHITPTKTTWEKVQDHKLRTTAGGFTTMMTAIGAAETARTVFDEKASGEEKIKTILASALFAALSYYLLEPIFSTENNNTPPEQNNNQH